VRSGHNAPFQSHKHGRSTDVWSLFIAGRIRNVHLFAEFDASSESVARQKPAPVASPVDSINETETTTKPFLVLDRDPVTFASSDMMRVDENHDGRQDIGQRELSKLFPFLD